METSSFFKAKRSSTPRHKTGTPRRSIQNTTSRFRQSLTEPMSPTEVRDSDTLQIIKMVLKKPADERTDLDLKKLVPFLKQIQFFKDRNLKD